MGLMDRLKSFLGDVGDQRSGGGAGWAAPRPTRGATASGRGGRVRSDDEIAIDRYKYLLRTAPPDAVEEVHAEAFANLTPQQRRTVFEELSTNASPADRPADDDPRTLARSATRSELRRPGFLERTFGAGGGAARAGGPGLGTMIGGSLLGTVAGVVIGSAIADAVLPGIGDMASGFGDGVQDLGDGVADVGSDVSDGLGDFGGGFGDLGGGFGDLGGDF